MTHTVQANEDVAQRAGAYRLERDLAYRHGSQTDELMRERCRLDVYVPVGSTGFATVIWVHGGGLREQAKFIPPELMEQGIGVVSVNYRLHPQVKAPAYVEDVAAAVAWVFARIASYGGSPERLFLSGHSAGCYLADLVTLDKRYLAVHGVDPDRLAGNISLSAHKIDHFTVREERGIPGHRAWAGALAPLCHVRADAPPMLLVTGDRDLELLGRYEENAYFWRMMKLAGHPDVELHELKGLDHGGMLGPSYDLLLDFVRRKALARNCGGATPESPPQPKGTRP